MEKAREFQKNFYFCFIDYAKAFDCKDHNKLWKILRWEPQTILSVTWETCMQDKKHQLEPNMKQQIGSKLGEEYDKAVYGHPAYLNSMQNTLCKMPGWIIHKLESRLLWEISITSDMQMTSCFLFAIRHYGRKWRGTEEPLDEGEAGEWKSWLKTQHSGNYDHGN